MKWVRDSHVPSGSSPGPPCEKRVRELGPVVGLCFGSYGEASPELHHLIDLLAGKMAEPGQQASGLGCPKERCKGVFRARLQMAWGVTAVRERARLVAARAPLIGVETIARRDGLLGATAPGSGREAGILRGHHAKNVGLSHQEGKVIFGRLGE